MREAYRLQKILLQTCLEDNYKNVAVFFIYTGKELPDHELVSERLKGAIDKLEKILQPVSGF